MSAQPLRAIRGMNDMLPDEAYLWQYLEDNVREVFQQYGYRNIRTPIVEYTSLFVRGVGEVTDIVEKEMYSFEDSMNGDKLSLRPEGTAGVARAYIEHGLRTAPQPVKAWYAGPMFRYERPQAGRQRQFHQIGVEMLGVADPRSDVEAIALAWDLLADLGVGGLALGTMLFPELLGAAKASGERVAGLPGWRLLNMPFTVLSICLIQPGTVIP